MKKALSLHLRVIGILSILNFSSCIMTAEPETFLVPIDFRGRVNIIYNQKCGEEPEFENDRRIYRIPNNGLLLTKFKKPSGLIDHQYYLVNENGTRTKLTKMDVRDYNEDYTITKNPNEPSRDTLGVFKWGSLGNATGIDNNDSYSFQEFFVTDYNGLGKTYGKEYMNFTKLISEKRNDCK